MSSEVVFDCSGRVRHSNYDLLAAFVCGTSQNWHSQHFVNPMLAYCWSQNALLSILIPGINEIWEYLLRIHAFYFGSKGSDGHAALDGPESGTESMIYDWLIQGFGGVYAGMQIVALFNIYLRDPYFWTCRVLNGFILFAITIGLEILFQTLEPGHHWLSVLTVATANILGFLMIRLWYESRQICDLFCCCRCKSPWRAIYHVSPLQEEHPSKNIYWQVGLYALVVYAVFIGGASTN